MKGMKGWRDVRSLGLGAMLCGGLSGLVFLVYADKFSRHAAFDDVLLAGVFLGAACQRLLAAFVFKPLQFYARLLQVTLLGSLIGEQTRREIIEELTLRYFLDERRAGREASRERDAVRGPTADAPGGRGRRRRADGGSSLTPDVRRGGGS